MMKNKVILLFFVIASAFVYSRALCAEPGQGECQVIFDLSLDGRDDAAAAWMAYGLNHVLWHREEFSKKFPDETSYRYTFEEEVDCRTTLAKVWTELRQANPALKDKYLDELASVYSSGFIKKYVFSYFNLPEWQVNEDLKIDDYRVWAEENIPGHEPQTLVTVSCGPKM